MIIEKKLRPVRTGKIKIGDTILQEINKNGIKQNVQRPVGLDHFRIIGGEFAVHQKYGDKPSELPVYLDELSDLTWDVNYKRYSATSLICKGDGHTGYESSTEGLIERDCALKGCPYAAGDRPSCRIIGLLNLKVVEVPSIGVYTLEQKGEWAVSKTEAFLRGLNQAAGGNLAGIPFTIKVKRINGQKGTYSAVELCENEETSKALYQNRLPTHLELEEATSIIITNSKGQNIASPQLNNQQDPDTFHQLANTIQEGIDMGCFTPRGEEEYIRLLQGLGNLSNSQAQEKTNAIRRWLDTYQNTKHQELHLFPKELASAVAAGIPNPEHLSREELRKLLRGIPL